MKRYTIEEKNWLKENYPLLGSKKCMEHLNRSNPSICQTARKLGCVVSRSLRNKLHSETLISKFSPSILPEVFENVNTKEAAYVMGILWADGWTQASNDYSINIKLVKDDFIELLPIFDKLGNWKRYDYYPKNRRPTIQLRLSGKQIVDIFNKLGYNTKSYSSANTVLSTIPDNLKKYWWRGYFDGDGHIRSSHPYRLEFSSAWNQDWSFLPLEYPFKISITKSDKSSYSKAKLCSKSEILKFGNMLWNEWDEIGLSRKYNEFMKLMSSYENKKSRIIV